MRSLLTFFLQLFGQKWSSSVPLFAQTLSFSPLTPAKLAEANGGSAAVAFNGREPTTPPASVAVNSLKVKEESSAEALPAKDDSSEVC